MRMAKYAFASTAVFSTSIGWICVRALLIGVLYASVFGLSATEVRGETIVDVLQCLGLRNEGKPERALPVCNRAIESIVSRNRPDEMGLLGETYAYRGLVHADLGEFDSAVSDYTKGIQLQPEFDAAYNNRGTAYSEMGDYKSAIADFTKAIQINPEYVNAYMNRGYTYDGLKEFDLAIADFDKVLSLNPKDRRAEVYHARAISYANKGDRELAIADFRRALQIDPSMQSARNNLKILNATP
jgi:tetratricopeptide (TPR) repeat protein